jgi:hypothetical protein
MPRRGTLGYLARLLLFASLIIGGAHTWYLIDARRGVAAPLEAALGGMEIRGGVLVPGRPLPFEVPGASVAALFIRLFGYPAGTSAENLPRVVIDTAHSAAGAGPRIVLQAEKIVFLFGASTVSLRYRDALLGSENLRFTRAEVTSFLRRKSPAIMASFTLFNGFLTAVTTLVCVCLLAFAPYIFRIDRRRPLSFYMSIAVRAVSPVPAGAVLLAVSGVNTPGASDLFFIGAVVVMFRGLRAATVPPDQGGEERRI